MSIRTPSIRLRGRALTDDERQTIAMIMAGARTADISRALYITKTTVDSRLWRIRAKLGADTNAHAVAILLDQQHAGPRP